MRKAKSGISVRERIDFYSIPEPNTGCILWFGSVEGPKSHKYGVLYIESKRYPVHRLNYELNVGSIPEGMEIMHKCDTPACINPQHLKIATHKENMQDCLDKGRNPSAIKQTHCKNGHEFTPENTRIKLHKKRNQYHRLCKKCDNARETARMRKKTKISQGCETWQKQHQ